MSRRLRFDAEARAELDDAALRYERSRAGLGGDFAAAVGDAIETVRDWPGLGAPVSERQGVVIRRTGVKRFPYYVGYVATDEELRVLAVAHERRRPRYWIPRL